MRQTFSKITPAIKKEILRITDERIKDEHVTKEDFSELKSIVGELPQSQRGLTEALICTNAFPDAIFMRIAMLAPLSALCHDIALLPLTMRLR